MRIMKIKGVLAIVSFLASIVLANWLTSRYGLVEVGLGLLATAGAFAAGASLLARDAVQVTAGRKAALVAIVSGCIVSWFVGDGRIALASAAAFFLAELLDFFVFTTLRSRLGTFESAAVGSNIVSAPVDTLAFLAIAGFPLTAAGFAGQMVGKLVWATAVPVALYCLIHALLRKSVNARRT